MVNVLVKSLQLYDKKSPASRLDKTGKNPKTNQSTEDYNKQVITMLIILKTYLRLNHLSMNFL